FRLNFGSGTFILNDWAIFCMFFRALMGVERATRRRLLREKQQRKIAESGVLEEAGALPAESVRQVAISNE
ncbi:hypothetical protein P4631_03210, partial [Halalkalibacterium halodurans]|uniref:hypothetical protein n=3 Tax=Halalkalibacterium halodurans TaxID=86665 RepID=UPI002E1F1A2D|nr:hypothetical protein [Halalkalibacterium halodurans]